MTLEKPPGGVLVRQYADRLAGILHNVLVHPPVDRPLVVLFTGSRKAERDVWEPVVEDCLDVIRLWLLRYVGTHRPVVRQGGAPGIDTLARRAGGRLRWTPDEMPARWMELGPNAGPIRNQAMVDKGADVAIGILAQTHSPGTVDCLARIHNAQIPRVVITVEDLYMPRVEPRATW